MLKEINTIHIKLVLLKVLDLVAHKIEFCVVDTLGSMKKVQIFDFKLYGPKKFIPYQELLLLAFRKPTNQQFTNIALTLAFGQENVEHS